MTDIIFKGREDLPLNLPEDFERLTTEEKTIVKKWINANFQKIKGMNKNHTSYGYKHVFEEDKESGGFYITNGQFKGAMLACGFITNNKSDLNWYFNVSEKSVNALKKKGLIT